jgi:hypothetical protein
VCPFFDLRCCCRGIPAQPRRCLRRFDDTPNSLNRGKPRATTPDRRGVLPTIVKGINKTIGLCTVGLKA